MRIQTFHLYNRLARRGLVQTLKCDFCQAPYVTRADAEGQPLLQCIPCGTMIAPGLNLYERLEAQVNEFYDTTN